MDAPAAPKAADPPTGDASLEMFGLDAGAADAARAAVTSGPRPQMGPRPAPFAKTLASPGASNGKGLAPLAPTGNDAEISTASSSQDALARARQVDAPEPLEEMEEEESTRAVPREELFRGQDAHVVVGDDAAGEDATLAVGPGDNEANSKHLAALAKTMAAEPDQAGAGGAFPLPPGVFPPPPGAGPVGASSLGAAPPSWNEPQQAWGGVPSPMGHDRPTSNPHVGSNPQIGSNPQMPVSNPHGMMGLPQSGHIPASSPMNMQGQAGMSMHHSMQGTIPYPGQHGGPMMHGQGGVPWNNPAPGSGKGIKLSNQIILLAVVGVVCLAIFITGIVLFATTKF